jgi:hypothetical protein
MLSERARLAVRRAASVESWSSTIMRSFQISTVDTETGSALLQLRDVVGEHVDEWLTLLTDEHQFLMAAAREQFDRDKKTRKAKTESAVAAAKELREATGEDKPKARRKKTDKNPEDTADV